MLSTVVYSIGSKFIPLYYVPKIFELATPNLCCLVIVLLFAFISIAILTVAPQTAQP